MEAPDEGVRERPNSIEADGPRQPEGAIADGELFPHAPARPAIQMAVLTWLVGMVAVVVMVAVSGARPALITLGVVGFQSLFGGVFHWLLVRRCGVRVGPEGLAIVAPLVADRWTMWDDIHAVRARHILLTPQLVLTGAGRPVVVPFVFRDPDGFAEAVVRCAGEDHPLTEAVYERLAAE